jgi:hypothetical protein
VLGAFDVVRAFIVGNGNGRGPHQRCHVLAPQQCRHTAHRDAIRRELLDVEAAARPFLRVLQQPVDDRRRQRHNDRFQELL